MCCQSPLPYSGVKFRVVCSTPECQRFYHRVYRRTRRAKPTGETRVDKNAQRRRRYHERKLEDPRWYARWLAANNARRTARAGEQSAP